MSSEKTVSAKKRGPGPKPRKGDSALSVVKAFRVDEETSAGLDAQLAASGFSASEWLREAVLANRTEVVAKQKPAPEYKRLLFLANKASNNINQLAHRANADYQARTLSQESYREILLELKALNRYLDVALKNGSGKN